MNKTAAILVLFLASVLEAGGDALIRNGLHRGPTWERWALLASGCVILSAYGWVVNCPPWDFGQLLGLYVVFFFVTAQLIAWLFFKQPPTAGTVWGGLLIVAGGVVLSITRR